MKKSNIAGWKDVFNFTLIQTLKSKTFIVSYVILISLILISMPIMNMITSGGKADTDTPSPVQKVYVDNQTTLPDMDFTALKESKSLGHIDFVPLQEDYDTVSKQIEEKEAESIILTIKESEGMFSLIFEKAGKGPVKDNHLQALSTSVAEQFEAFRIDTLGISEDQNTMLHAAVTSNVTLVDENGNPIVKEDTSISSGEYWFIYGILFVVLMVNMMASSQIATSIVTEKSTRVVEYLLTSVKPLALMVGKILAMLVAVILQVVSLVVVLFLSNQLSSSLSPEGGESVMSRYLSPEILGNLNPFNLLLALILIALGMIFYATLAGLAGATVSKLEEINEGLTLFTVISMIGAYIGIGAANVLMGSGDNAFVTFAFLFPLSSPFVLPGAILIGKASLLLVGIAIILQVIFIILLSMFVAKVYETLILHNGNTIKFNELIKISKTL